MAVAVKTKNGKKLLLLNPSEKAHKYSIELKHGRALTNDGKPKIDKKTGKYKRLTKEQKAFRAGFLAHQKDCNKAFKANHPRYKRKTR